MYSVVRIAKAIATVLGCTMGAVFLAGSAIVVGSLLIFRGEGALGDGLLYLAVLIAAALLGAAVGLIWADDQLRRRTSR